MTERDKLGDCDSWQESNFASLLFETQLQAEWQLPYIIIGQGIFILASKSMTGGLEVKRCPI